MPAIRQQHSEPASPRPDARAALPRLDRFHPKDGPVRKSRLSKWRVLSLVAVHLLVLGHVLWWQLAGRTLTPLEPSESMQTLEKGLINAGFVLFAAAILSTLVLGRWFCGWTCHVVAWQDLAAWLLGRLGLRPRPLRSRALVLVPFAVAFYMFVWPQLLRLWHTQPPLEFAPNFTTEDLWATFPGVIMSVVSVLMVGFLIVWWLGAKGFCTYGCPYGAFFTVADRFAPLRVRVDDSCSHCGHCTSVCSSNVRVHEEVAKHGMVVDPGCMKCADCVSVCPKDALRIGFGRIAPLQTSQQRLQARADFSWPEEVLLVVAGLAAFWAFRGAWIGEGVPMLLAVALAVTTAVAALLVVRLPARSSVMFQHTVLRSDGRLTRAGRLAAVLLPLWLLFTAHTGVIRELTHDRTEAAWALMAQAKASPGSVKLPAAQAMTDELAAVDRWSLCTDPRLLGALGVLLDMQQRDDAAIAAIERMRARSTHTDAFLPEAELALARCWFRKGRVGEAKALVEGVLARNPDNATARMLLQTLPK